MTKTDRLGARDPTTTAVMSRQEKKTVFFGPSFTRIQAATKLPTIFAAEMALFTDEGRWARPNSAVMSGVMMEPTIQEALKKE